jgi:hypothetical protein
VRTADGLARQDPEAIGSAMEEYGKNKSGPFASSDNIAGGFLPVVDLVSPNREPELTINGKNILELLLKTQVDDGKPFTKDHTAFVGTLLSTPTEGSGRFFSHPAQGNFIPKTGITTLFGVRSQEISSQFVVCCYIHCLAVARISPLLPRLQSLQLIPGISRIHSTSSYFQDTYDMFLKSLLQSLWRAFLNPTEEIILEYQVT